jgi:hypothetical protein
MGGLIFIIVFIVVYYIVFSKGKVRKYLEDKMWNYVTKNGEFSLPKDKWPIKDRWLNLVVYITFGFIGLMLLFAWLT